MNIFSNLRVYAGKWSVKETRNFTADEISQVSQAVVVPSQYGNSVQFTMVSGGLVLILIVVEDGLVLNFLNTRQMKTNNLS